MKPERILYWLRLVARAILKLIGDPGEPGPGGSDPDRPHPPAASFAGTWEGLKPERLQIWRRPWEGLKPERLQFWLGMLARFVIEVVDALAGGGRNESQTSGRPDPEGRTPDGRTPAKPEDPEQVDPS